MMMAPSHSFFRAAARCSKVRDPRTISQKHLQQLGNKERVEYESCFRRPRRPACLEVWHPAAMAEACIQPSSLKPFLEDDGWRRQSRHMRCLAAIVKITLHPPRLASSRDVTFASLVGELPWCRGLRGCRVGPDHSAVPGDRPIHVLVRHGARQGQGDRDAWMVALSKGRDRGRTGCRCQSQRDERWGNVTLGR